MQPLNTPSAQSWSQKIITQMESFDSETFKAELRKLFTFRRNPVAITKSILFTIGALLTFITFSGVLIGYAHGYRKFMADKGELPRLYKLPRPVIVAMILGGVLVWSILIGALLLVRMLFSEAFMMSWASYIFLGVNILLSLFVYGFFRRWRVSNWNLLAQSDTHGTARYANVEKDFADMINRPGLYIGGPLRFTEKGNILTCAGTRGGKGANFLMKNVFDAYGFEGSKVIIDVKGELCAVWAKHLISIGKRVVILNPWDLLDGLVPGKSPYNPLDMVSDPSSPHLIDDLSIIAEMIIPRKDDDKNRFFSDNARNIIASLLLHLVTTDKIEKPTLVHLWEWTRLYGKEWDELLADMADSNHPVHGATLRNAANECLKMMEANETYSSIMSNVLESTNFIKSGPLQQSLQSGLDPYTVADGNTIVFVVFPVDKLQSHPNWLRLVVSTLMRSIVRKPSKHRTVFICDEAASLGHSKEWETALAAYAGFNITMWLVYQDLAQVADIYGKRWESVMANCTVRQFTSIRDHFTADYIHKLMGESTRLVYGQDWMGNISEKEATQRPLATANEVTRMSENSMIVFVGERPVAVFPKHPYWLDPAFKDASGNNLYEPNPYIEDSL